jgi:hypothetical protein
MVYTSSAANWQEAFLLALSDTLINVLSYVPTILAALLVFLMGLILAKWGRILTVKILKTVQLSNLVKKSGFQPYLKKAEVSEKLEELVGNLVRWLIILIFFIANVNLLPVT